MSFAHAGFISNKKHGNLRYVLLRTDDERAVVVFPGSDKKQVSIPSLRSSGWRFSATGETRASHQKWWEDHAKIG